MRTIFLITLILLSYSLKSQTMSDDTKITIATLAAPEEMRAEAMVYGYSDDGEMVVLKKGTNDIICLGDDPTKEGISVACYHKSLEPFMDRGRELKKEGKNYQESFNIREEEVSSGKLKMPDNPSTLYVLSGKYDDFNEETGDLEDSYLRYVIYIPYATSETTGLDTKPSAPGQPWIMDPGTHKAHIMISPPKD